MTTKSSISIVKGYHAGTPVPMLAREANLLFRFAIVLNSYNPDFDYMYFQDVLFLEILGQFAQIIDHETILLEIDNAEFQSIEAFREYLLANREEDRQPPHSIHFKKNRELICFEETEFWVLCGGEAPYSDSYTLSFYTKEDMAEQFEQACIKACNHTGTKVNSIIQASVEPVALSLWRKLFNKFK